MFAFIKRLFNNNYNVPTPGLLFDNRSKELKDKDYTHEEIATLGASLVWKEKGPLEWRHYPIKNQNGSSACVFFATAKALGIENEIEEGEYVEFSPRDGYPQRFNKPALGSYFYDALEIATKKGLTLESFMPSENLSETKMNDDSDRKTSYNQVARVFKAGGYFTIKNINIDTIASVIQEGRGVVLGFTFEYDEWTDTPVAKYYSPRLGHAVCAVDYCLVGGKKCLIIEDSWGIDRAIQGRRIITEEFLNKRCFYAGYFMKLRNDWRDNDRPIYDGTVSSMQDCLKSEGLFPTNVASINTWGPMTDKSVQKFCEKYNIKFVAGRKIWVELDTLLRSNYK
jgi:hypothetical protein